MTDPFAFLEQKRRSIYADFEDLMGDETPVDLPGFAAPDGAARGPDGLFPSPQVDELVAVLQQVRARAVAA